MHAGTKMHDFMAVNFMCFAGRFRAQIWFNDVTMLRQLVIIEVKLSLGFGWVITILKGGE